jgi:Tfp pilus assembly protein PilF
MATSLQLPSVKQPWIWVAILCAAACGIAGFELAVVIAGRQPPAPVSSVTPTRAAVSTGTDAVASNDSPAPQTSKGVSPGTLPADPALPTQGKGEDVQSPPNLPDPKTLPHTADIAALVGAAGSVDTLRAPAAFPKGMLAFLKGIDQLGGFHLPEATALFAQAIAADGENSDFYTARGGAYVLAEKMNEGLPDLQRAMKLNPRNILASRLTRLAYLMLGEQLAASKFYGHGSTQRPDFLIQEVGVGYGRRMSAQPNRHYQDVRDQQMTAAAIQKLPIIAGMVADAYRAGDQKSAETLFALGVEQFQAGDFAAARRNFADVIRQNANDFSARYYYARCMLETGDPELARRELTYVLCWQRFLPEAFAARAICATRQSDAKRAAADLKSAEKLDAAKAAEARVAVARAPQGMPPMAGSDATQWNALGDESRKNADFEELTKAAATLRKTVDARRNRWDEHYQDTLYELCSAVRDQPVGDRVADLAAFLRDNEEVHGLQVEPNGAARYFRRQTPETRDWEISLALNLVIETLRTDPGHARCLAIKASLLYAHFNRCEEAEAAALAALRSNPRLIEGHLALSDCYKTYAARWRSKAAELRTPKTYSTVTRVVDQHGNFIRDDTVVHSIPPSAEDLARAARCDRQAELNAKREQASLSDALQCAKGTPQEPYYQALLSFLHGDCQSARRWLEKAVQANPRDARMRYALANCLKLLGLTTEYLEELSRAVDLQETTADLWLHLAWYSLEHGDWDSARTQLQRACQHDPSDPRIYAFWGVLEEFGSRNEDAAAAAYRCALAQEEARAQLNGTSYADAKAAAALSPESLGLSMMLRLKLARMAFHTQPDTAIAYYSATAANEKRMSDWGLAESVHSALLPNPERNKRTAGGAPPLVSILKNNRIFLGQALLNRGKNAEAAAQFAEAEHFGNRLPSGGTAYLEFELDPQYVPFRVSSMPIYVKALHAQTLIVQGKREEARLELQQVRYYLANRTQEQRTMTGDPIPGIYERLAGTVGLR